MLGKATLVEVAIRGRFTAPNLTPSGGPDGPKEVPNGPPEGAPEDPSRTGESPSTLGKATLVGVAIRGRFTAPNLKEEAEFCVQPGLEELQDEKEEAEFCVQQQQPVLCFGVAAVVVVVVADVNVKLVLVL